MSGPKLSLNGISLNAGLAEEIAVASSLGFDYLEMRLPKLEAFLRERPIEDVPMLFNEAHVRPLSINGIEPIAIGPGETLAGLADRARHCLRMAGGIGCECVVVNPYGMAPHLSERDGRQRVVDGLRFVSDIAAEYDVQLAYEFLDQQYPVHTIADTLEVLEVVNRDNLGWLLDFHFFHVADRSLESLVRAGADRLLLVHVNDLPDRPLAELALGKATRVFPGDGVVMTEGILKTLHCIGYRGPFSVEILDPKFLTWDPLEFGRMAKAKMLAVLDRYYR